MSDKKTCGCPIEMPYGCPIHNPLPSAASPSHAALIAETASLRAEVKRLIGERDTATCHYCGRIGSAPAAFTEVERLTRENDHLAILTDGNLLARALKAEAACAGMREALSWATRHTSDASHNPGICVCPVHRALKSSCGQPLLDRLAALERVAEAARGFRRAAKAPLGDPAGWSAQTYETAEALFAALGALAELDGKEKP